MTDEKNDDGLQGLRDVAREEQAETDAWWTAAEAGDANGLPEGVSLDAVRPLDDAERDAMTAELFGLAADAPVTDDAPASEAPAAANEDAAPAPVISLASRRRKVWGAVLSGALAAGLAALTLSPGASSLPGYALEARAGEQALRGEPETGGQATYTQGSLLTFVLRPAQAVDGEVTVDVVLRPAEGEPRVVPMAVQAAPAGALRVTAELGRTFEAAPGRYSLVFLVAPKGRRVEDPITASKDGAGGVVRLEHKFVVTPAGS